MARLVLLEAPLRVGGGQLQHQVGGRDEARLDAGHDGAVGQCDGQVALAHAGGPEEDDVLGPLDEGQARQLGDLRTWHAGGEAEVELLERLDRRQRGQLHQGRALPFRAGLGFGIEQPLEEVAEAAFAACDVLGDGGPVDGDAFELERLGLGGNAHVLQVVHAPTPESKAS